METQKVRTCFTITFSDDQYSHAKSYVEDMRKHPQRVFWQGKEGKSEEELVVEQIAHANALTIFGGQDELRVQDLAVDRA